ncbi:MAG: ATP-grasp domain-containing protein [Bacteroidetes bacterium]|nr:ATP-grasp domain-containing protein [Bacteroidota bacterium]
MKPGDKLNFKFKILITDGGSVNALGIIRHLGLCGKFELIVIGYNSLALGKFSKYSNRYFILPHPKKNSEGFINGIKEIITKENIDFVLPVGFYAHKSIIDNLSMIEPLAKVCLPSKSSFEIATSKIETTQLAERAGVLVPKTKTIRDLNELKTLAGLTFPVVIKSQKEIGGRMVEYAYSEQELVSKFTYLVSAFDLNTDNYPIIQEYITGEGVGFFAFYKHGKLMNYFMHERIREFPVSGGRSVCARSFYDEKLLENGKKMLDALGWNGSAMVEFKRTKQNEYYLLEVNPKLWGSIELAMCSGVDFPLLMINDAFEVENNVTLNNYQRDLYFQWCLNGELYHFFNKPYSIFKIIKTSFTSRKDFWFRDIKPNLIQFLLIFIDLYKVIKPKK